MRSVVRSALGFILVFAVVGVPPAIASGKDVASTTAQTTRAPGRQPTAAASGQTREARVQPSGERPADSLSAATIWFLALLLIGIAALPLAYTLFPYLDDRGAGFAKVLGLALSTFLASILVRYRIFHQGRLIAHVGLSLVASASVLCLLSRREMVRFWFQRRRALLAGEAVFALGFVFFLGLRSFNPEISWGEKPMDFSILNILVRTRVLPPSDPWLAGAPLGYYVFGQEMVALLTLLTGLSTRYTFNLAFGLLGGAVAQGAFCLARAWAGRVRAGLASAAFTLVLGNLAGLREWLVNQRLRGEARHLDWHYFWATSRVVRDTINEYPLWSLLFADLHAHVLALPLLFLLAASALQLIRAHADAASSMPRRLLCALVLAFAAATDALTNAWDVPLLGGLFVLLLSLTALSEPRFRFGTFFRAAASFTVALTATFAFLRPLWVRGGGAPGFGWNVERGARGVDVLTHFGFFFFLCLAWWAVSASTHLARRGFGRGPRLLLSMGAVLVLATGLLSAETLCAVGILLFLFAIFAMTEQPEDRLAFGFVATAFFLVLFTQRLFIYDRMNTFFKLYFEAWPLLAVATAVLIFGSPNRAGAFETWPAVFRGAFFLLAACALFTTVTAVRGGTFAPNNPSRRGAAAGAPSLDGLRYLEKQRPGEYQAVLWLRRTLRGTPVILEAQGESYQDFSRISMLTGLPTVLGWEHHVKQRGNPEAEVEARRSAVQQVYTSKDPAQVEPLLRRYHVGYVYVGWLERQTYQKPKHTRLTDFDADPRLFQLVYENPEVKIYRVVGGDTESVPMPKRERIETPPAASAKPPGSEREEPPRISQTPSQDLPPFAGMKEPRDAAVDDKGRLWIADFGNSRLRVFDGQGGLLGGWGGRGNGTYGLREPCGVAVRGDDLYIADTWNGRLEHFRLDGEWKSAANGFYGPRGVATAPDGSVWATDTGNNRVIQFDANLEQKGAFGQKGSGPGQFSQPVGIAVGPSGTVYVADPGNQRIQMLDASGGFLRAFRFPGWREPGVEPHLEVGSDETVYATDPAGNRVVALDRSGTVRRGWEADAAGKRFSRPTGVAIDEKNDILYVVNSGDNSVSKIKLSERKAP